MEGGEGQSFEEAAKQFSLKREETTPNTPFADERSIFEEEAPTIAQRRLALDFYNGVSSLVNRHRDTYPTPLAIIELHQLYLEALRASVPQGEIVPEFDLTHVIGASKRLLAYAKTAGYYGGEEAYRQAKWMQENLEINLALAARLEAVDYPLVSQQEAIGIQQRLWQEAQAFLATKEPDYARWLTLEKITPGAYPFLQFFPEEHPREGIRQLASGAVWAVEHDLKEYRERLGKSDSKERFGVREAVASATKFGHDDIEKYSLVNVLGAAKRNVLWQDVHRQWGDQTRDAFTATKVLTQAVANRPPS